MDTRLDIARLVVLTLMAAWSVSVFADPPDQAPAHGWRNKHERHHDRHYYSAYTGREWENDFAITSGHCNREAIATVVGGVVGGVIASRVADENRTVATLIGVAAGALVGNRVGEKLDEADRSCIGHALELGEPGRRVVWTNDATRVSYELSPGPRRDRHGTVCREFAMLTISGRERSTQAGVACQSRGGVWQIEQ